MNAAIITARFGSPENPDKNMYPVDGKPLIAYPVESARKAKLVDEVFVSTDAPDIIAYCRAEGISVIERPAELTKFDVNHGDVIKHAVDQIDGMSIALENVVVLLGNSVMIEPSVIDAGLELLDKDAAVDSCMTVWQALNDHPERAMQLQDGALAPYANKDRNVTTEHEAYRPAYFFDQGAWIFRKECVARREGPSPWWWMGRNCRPLVRPWVQGRDVHRYFDLFLAEWWITHREKIARILGDESFPKA